MTEAINAARGTTAPTVREALEAIQNGVISKNNQGGTGTPRDDAGASGPQGVRAPRQDRAQGDKRVVTLRLPKEVVAKCTMGASPSGQKAAFARGRVP